MASEGGKEECLLNKITGGMGGSAEVFVTRTREAWVVFTNRTRATARRAEEERKKQSRRSQI